MSGSAIFKIEKADPPRRITVDELVALAQVFETTVENLLIPIEVLEREHAQDLLKALEQVDVKMLGAVAQAIVIYSELFVMAADEPELYEYVHGHHYRENGDDGPVPSFVTFEDDDTGESFGIQELGVDESALRRAFAEFYTHVLKQAGTVAKFRRIAQRRTEVTS